MKNNVEILGRGVGKAVEILAKGMRRKERKKNGSDEKAG